MDFKKLNKEIGRFIGWITLVICSLIIKIIPGSWLYRFSEGLAGIGFIVLGKHKQVAKESLETAFGKEKNAKEINSIIKRCFSCMIKSALELLFLLDKPALLDRKVRIEGKENLEEALSRGKGVILISAHFGNFPLILTKLCLEGYKCAVIMRHMRDRRIEKILFKHRDLYGLKSIYTQPRNTCVEDTIKSLRNNEIVFIPMDQNFGTAGVYVDFFGKKAATATGPVIFAQRTKAAILPCFIIRQEDDSHKVIFEPPLEWENGRNPKETISINVQKITRVIEAYIRRYPAEWGWIHRRWKSRPKEEKQGG